jgi:hypothetical protein
MKYRDWKSVPLPARMQGMSTDKRGYPVPYIVIRDIHGVPNFAINDDNKVEHALKHDLCAICGDKIPKHDKWLVGGPMSAFHSHGAYIDTPTHGECLHYAMKVCPYLAVKNYMSGIDLSKIDGDKFPNALLFQNPTQDETRVPFFVAVRILDYEISRPMPGKRFIHPRRDYQEIEYWWGGEKIDEHVAAELMREHFNNPKKGVK